MITIDTLKLGVLTVAILIALSLESQAAQKTALVPGFETTCPRTGEAARPSTIVAGHLPA